MSPGVIVPALQAAAQRGVRHVVVLSIQGDGAGALTYDEIATILSAELGRPIRYADPGLLAFLRPLRHRGLPRAMVGVMLGIYTAARLGLDAGITDDVERITGRPPIAFAAFAHDSRGMWLSPS